MTTYVYHYCAICSDGTKIDGIFQSENHILTIEHYSSLKKLIWPVAAWELTIHSLSLLHIVEDL